MGVHRKRGLCGVALTFFATLAVPRTHARGAAALRAPTYYPIALPTLLHRFIADGLVTLTRLGGCACSGATVD